MGLRLDEAVAAAAASTRDVNPGRGYQAVQAGRTTPLKQPSQTQRTSNGVP